MTQLQDVIVDGGLGLVRMDKRTHLLYPEGDSGWATRYADGYITA